MHHAELTDSVRHLVAASFAELQFTDGNEPRETLLIRGGAYCGRRYESPGGHALWFFEEDQLKLFSADGRVLRVIERVSAASVPTRMAA
jgi:hypothetical protein